MFIEMTILYPFSNTRTKLVDTLNKQKQELTTLDSCIEFSIYNDTYSNKIIHIVKWTSKDEMKVSIDRKSHKKRVEEILNLQKFPAEVYRLEEHN
tara:strand:- start:157 stop:441 length:285 start_codon:yes stop_codon:yes gene_type:complete